MSLLPIRYADFYDVPRLFVVERDQSLYLFDCAFDQRAFEYPDRYVIYRLRGSSFSSIANAALAELLPSAERVATCLVSDIHFDATRRATIDDAHWPVI